MAYTANGGVDRATPSFAELLLDEAPDALLALTLDGRILWWNRGAEAMFGYSADETVGRFLEDLVIPEEHRAEARADLARVAECGSVLVETSRRRKDGCTIQVDVSMRRVSAPKLGQFVAVCKKDVTQLNALRERAAERKRLVLRTQEANRLKSEFLANMSHELRTPLNAIIGFAELMHRGRVGPVSEEHREYLGDILTSSKHLLQLVNDVLDLSKVEAGKMEFRPQKVDLAVLVGEVRDILRGLAAAKRLRVEARVDPAAAVVEVDPPRVKQVLYNYLSNAIKFTPEGGAITIRIEGRGPELFCLAVEDTGVGIAAEDFDKLFVEFQQLDAGMGKRYPGSGLGLALTRKIVESHGGRVEVRSTLGLGSTFSAVLPRKLKAEEWAARSSDAVAPAEPVAPGDAIHVLVVEDEPSDRECLVGTLRAAGYAVDWSATGADAIAMCRTRSFQAITLDLLLPDLHGWMVLREIRATELNRDVPVIAVTGSAAERQMSGFPLHDFLLKPVDQAVLLESLRRVGPPSPGGRPILVVDDDASALRLVEASLRALGYRPLCRATGQEGLRAAAAEAPAAVVLDLLMPSMDGFEFLARFRDLPACRRVPVIIWTVKDLSAVERARLRASAAAIVSKAAGGSGPLVDELRPLLGTRADRQEGRTSGRRADPDRG